MVTEKKEGERVEVSIIELNGKFSSNTNVDVGMTFKNIFFSFCNAKK